MTIAEANEILARASQAGFFREEFVALSASRVLEDVWTSDGGEEAWRRCREAIAEKATALLGAGVSVDAQEVTVERDAAAGLRVALMGAWGFDP